MSTESTTCTRCAGLGIVPCFRHIDGGTCYACDGSGVVVGAPKAAPRGATPGRLIATRIGRVFVSRAPKGHFVATTERGEGVPFLVVDGRVARCDWFPRYTGRADALLVDLQGALRAA